MSKLNLFIKSATSVISKNSPYILTAAAITGGFTAGIMAVKVTPKAEKAKTAEEHKKGAKLTIFETAKVYARYYWPSVCLGTVSAACAICANQINIKRQAAALAAYSISEGRLKDYQEAATKILGNKDEAKISDKVAETRMKNDPVDSQTIIFTGNGENLCYDSISGRYFKSTIEKVKAAVNEINRRLMLENMISLNDFYYELGLDSVDAGDLLGWSMYNVSDMIEINFSSQVATDGTPCLVLEYSVEPIYISE